VNLYCLLKRAARNSPESVLCRETLKMSTYRVFMCQRYVHVCAAYKRGYTHAFYPFYQKERPCRPQSISRKGNLVKNTHFHPSLVLHSHRGTAGHTHTHTQEPTHTLKQTPTLRDTLTNTHLVFSTPTWRIKKHAGPICNRKRRILLGGVRKR